MNFLQEENKIILEIRIGNFLEYWKQKEVVEVCGMSKAGNIYATGYCKGRGLSAFQFKGIPLTEEWLIKFGLKEFDGYFQKKNGFYAFRIKEGVDISGNVYYHPEKYSWTMFGFVGRLYYVHQLQNMYFALTGEELTLKQ